MPASSVRAFVYQFGAFIVTLISLTGVYGANETFPLWANLLLGTLLTGAVVNLVWAIRCAIKEEGAE